MHKQQTQLSEKLIKINQWKINQFLIQLNYDHIIIQNFTTTLQIEPKIVLNVPFVDINRKHFLTSKKNWNCQLISRFECHLIFCCCCWMLMKRKCVTFTRSFIFKILCLQSFFWLLKFNTEMSVKVLTAIRFHYSVPL